MEIGSVKFFKRLILTVAAIIVIVPLVLSILFGTLYSKQKKINESLEAINWALANGSPLPEGVNLPQDLPNYIQVPAGLDEDELRPSFEYQIKHPDLYAPRSAFEYTEDKVCFLTFDDGPSPVTTKILDVLAEKDVKATFFVTGRNSMDNTEILKRAADDGHTIGVHTWSHNYQTIYSSVDAYLEDFELMYNFVAEATGKSPEVFRFPGGSINVYNQKVYREVIAEMTRRNFVFYDWNAAASDAVAGGISASEVYTNVMNSAAGQQRLLILMHDRLDNDTTAAALPKIIDSLLEDGYRFEVLSASVPPVTFFYQE